MKVAAFTQDELFETFHGDSMSGKHVLLIYSFIVGLNAKVILDMGLGNSTRTCLAAAKATEATVYSCDMDRDRYARYQQEDHPTWRFYCMSSTEFLKCVPQPIDFVFHDASHEHDIVRDDMLAIIPMMRRYGLICVHDTQHPRYTLLEALGEVMDSLDGQLSMVTLPYGCGLSVLRVEESAHDPIVPAGRFRGERQVTIPRTLNRAAR